MNWLPKHSLIVGLGLIVVVNAIVLAGVAYNRSGEPQSALRLSERELTSPPRGYGNKENSGLALALNWRVLPPNSTDSKKYSWAYASNGGPANWLNQAKMLALGFDESDVSQHFDGLYRSRQPLPRDVLLVLELDGAAYKAALARAVQFSQAATPQETTQASAALKSEQEKNSRLFVVDAGLDVAALRTHYPDRSRYAIVHGQVSPNWVIEKNAVVPAGYVSGISANSVTVPLEWRHIFDGASAVREVGQASLRYAVDLKFGQRLEPWIAQATRVLPSSQ